jgi:hypothetical protein
MMPYLISYLFDLLIQLERLVLLLKNKLRPENDYFWHSITKDTFESLVHTSSSGADRAESPGKDGSWIQWGKPSKAPNRAEVQEFTESEDRRIETPTVTVKMISS